MRHYYLLLLLFFTFISTVAPVSNGWAIDTPQGKLTISPLTDEWDFTRISPGSYSPTFQELTFSNTGGGQLTFSLTNTATWYELTSSTGSLSDISLASGGSATITVTIIPSEAEKLTASTQTAFDITYGANSQGPPDYTVRLTISSTPPGILAVEPQESFWSTGLVGGPFVPESKTFLVSNTGGSPLNYTVSKTQPWVEISTTGGTLEVGGSTNVTLSFNSATEVLGLNTYIDTVFFSNTDILENTISRTVTLVITGTPPGVLSVSPTESFWSSGSFGGPFDPDSKTYTLTNTGAAPIDFTVTKTNAWLDLSQAGGTLAAGASTTVTVSLNSAADTLVVGDYSDTIIFTNTTNNYGDTSRPVTLKIGTSNPGVLSVSPTENFLSTGLPGGPFSPSTKNYTLTNTGGSSLDFTISHGESWVDASVDSGTLGAGESTIVTLSITSAANSLATGNYYDNVVFTNSTNGNGDTLRPVSLLVNASLTALMTVSPDDEYLAAGLQGAGPFNPPSITYTVTNTGGLTMDFTASATASWLTVSPTSGQLAKGESTSVTVSIDQGTATTLATDTYYDAVTFTNTTDGNGSTSRPVTLFVSTDSGILTVTPYSDMASFGIERGPFSPESKIYTITNNGTASMTFSVSKTATWLDVAPSSSTISAGGSTEVTLTINSGADSLPYGLYSDTVTFTNTTDGNQAVNRLVELTIDKGPFSWPTFLPAITTGKK